MTEQNTAQRLQEAAAKCLSSLDAWNNDLKNSEARETLLEAVHELRKVTSRLEIDIAMNDRTNVNAKPIPLPEHKSKMEKKKQKPLSEILPVAEIREANEKRKIEIQEANAENVETNDSTSTLDEPKEEKKEVKKPRTRRKKREEKPSSDE